SLLVERPSELDSQLLEGVRRVGITAGASTPDQVILAVIERLVELGFEPPERLWRIEEPELTDFAE
ncbi:MAG: 4-hydroxy-3-methylbut-2-enyl diphosphate reductase, partial [Thermomicrobium sp.]|nr:4-hydroxy-3-methylbut-2-enyl diphosphate reductase [Thermomicrobium sp.]